LLAGKDFSSRNLRGFAVNPGLDFHREAREENAKDFSLVAALLLCVHRRVHSCFAKREIH